MKIQVETLADIHVPIDQANSYQTAIENATWAQLNNLFNLEGETVIKEI